MPVNTLKCSQKRRKLPIPTPQACKAVKQGQKNKRVLFIKNTFYIVRNNFFQLSKIIRKAFKLLSKRPYQNAAAFETLDRFFPAWEDDLKIQVEPKEAGDKGNESRVAV